ncbi:hypothetical protein pb186bvf_007529 [Paramecium bursaria]
MQFNKWDSMGSDLLSTQKFQNFQQSLNLTVELQKTSLSKHSRNQSTASHRGPQLLQQMNEQTRGDDSEEICEMCVEIIDEEDLYICKVKKHFYHVQCVYEFVNEKLQQDNNLTIIRLQCNCKFQWQRHSSLAFVHHQLLINQIECIKLLKTKLKFIKCSDDLCDFFNIMNPTVHYVYRLEKI